MGSRMTQLLLLGICIVLFMDEGDRVLTTRWIRFCNKCDVYNGFECITGMQSCWKFNLAIYNRSCRTDHFYYAERLSGMYLYRYTELNCESCEEGMLQLFHDLLRETFCCSHDDRCNDPNDIVDTTKEFVSTDQHRIVSEE